MHPRDEAAAEVERHAVRLAVRERALDALARVGSCAGLCGATGGGGGGGHCGRDRDARSLAGAPGRGIRRMPPSRRTQAAERCAAALPRARSGEGGIRTRDRDFAPWSLIAAGLLPMVAACLVRVGSRALCRRHRSIYRASPPSGERPGEGEEVATWIRPRWSAPPRAEQPPPGRARQVLSRPPPEGRRCFDAGGPVPRTRMLSPLAGRGRANGSFRIAIAALREPTCVASPTSGCGSAVRRRYLPVERCAAPRA